MRLKIGNEYTYIDLECLCDERRGHDFFPDCGCGNHVGEDIIMIKTKKKIHIFVFIDVRENKETLHGTECVYKYIHCTSTASL